MSDLSDSIVAIIDDDEALRDALAVLVAAAGWRADGYSTAEDFLASLNGERAGCALIDIRLPGIDGMELFRRLAEVAPGFPVVILTGHGDVPMAVEALRAGAVDFIEKPFDPDRLLGSLRQALSRDAVLRETKLAVEEFHTRVDKLTPREHEAMDFMVLGQSNKMIAAKLGISPRTVEIYRARVMEKMEVRSLAELVRMTLRARDREAVTS
ncbi:MAG: response regulator [Rhodospirillaceae bacterium]